jgi:hypothetical protein
MKPETHASLGCSALDLARQYDALAGEWTKANEVGDPDSLLDEIENRMQEIIQAVSFVTARSKQGAAFQIMVASLENNGIANGTRATVQGNTRTRQHRLLYRVLEWIGLNDKELSDARFHAMPAQLDPREHRS